jgi:hypothetical protein
MEFSLIFLNFWLLDARANRFSTKRSLIVPSIFNYNHFDKNYITNLRKNDTQFIASRNFIIYRYIDTS